MQKNPIRPARALAPAALMLLQALTASAQDKPEDATPETTPTPEAPAASAPEAPATTSGPASATTEAPAAPETSTGVGASVGAEAEASIDSSGGADAEAESTTEATASPYTSENDGAETAGSDEDPAYGFGVMRLPNAAYPELQVRGIKGGSLWFTFHGHQWPYMPRRGSKPGLMLGLSGFAWVDPSYSRLKATRESDDAENDVRRKTWRTQGRAGVRFTPTYSQEEYFVQGQVELIANSNQGTTGTTGTDTDDLWVRAGAWNKWDVQLGRFEGWEVYHFGMGLDLHTAERLGAYLGPDGTQNLGPEGAPQIYGATYGYYRDDIGNIAGHVYPTDYLRFELLGKFGNQSARNTVGGRPVGVLDLGYVKVKVGGEYFKESEQDPEAPRERELRGVGAAVQGIYEQYVEAGINGGYGLIDAYDDEGTLDQEGTFTTYSYGGFANFGGFVENLVVGGGANYTWKDNVEKEQSGPNQGQVGEFDHLQVFGAVQYALFGQLYLKLVGSYAKARLAPTPAIAPPYDSTMIGLRFRASYYF